MGVVRCVSYDAGVVLYLTAPLLDLRYRRCRVPKQGFQRVGGGLGYFLSDRIRWNLDSDGTAYNFYYAARGCRLLLLHREKRKSFLRNAALPHHRDDRCFRSSGFISLFHILGNDVDPHVLPHRNLGREASHLFRDQVFPLHIIWIIINARRDRDVGIPLSSGIRRLEFFIRGSPNA